MPRAIPILSEFHNLSAGDLADQLGTLKAEIADLEARKRTIAGELIRRGVSEAEGALFRSLVVAETMVSTRGETPRGALVEEHLPKPGLSAWPGAGVGNPRTFMVNER